MARWLALVTITLVAFTLPSLVPAAEPLAMMTFATRGPAGEGFSPNVNAGATEVTVSVGGAEPSIVVDSLGRAILVGDHLGVFRSTNGGANWARVNVPWIPGNHPAIGGIYDGWALAQDDAGTIYATTTNGAIINVASSVDGGATWQQGVSTYVVEAGLIADRPWMAARGDGTVAMIWNEGGMTERCALSRDGALTFTQRTVPLLTSALPIGGVPDFDSFGRLYFAGNGGIGGGADTLYRYNSQPCSTSVTGIALPAHGDQLSTHVTIDDADRIYLSTPTASEDGIQLIGYPPSFQANAAQTLVVSPASLKGNTFATIDSFGDEIAVAWYGTTTPGDFQNTNFNGEWNVFVARVTGFWTASPSVTVTQLTTTPNHVGDFCMQGTNCDVGGGGDRDLLDYFQIVYDADGNLHVAYGHDGATSNAEVRYAMLPAL